MHWTKLDRVFGVMAGLLGIATFVLALRSASSPSDAHRRGTWW
jgi:hypothetical protein